MDKNLAVIGGSGLFAMQGLRPVREHHLATPFGATSAPIIEGDVDGQQVFFLARHGQGRHIPPHAINYRANIRALRDLGASHILTMNIVGGITPAMAPAKWIVPDQIVDYSWGREHSFYGVDSASTEHVDFTDPYDPDLSRELVAAAAAQNMPVVVGATYASTQGPRLESAAEIRRLQRDGCDIVGMTAMPEAALARELSMPYAALCLVVNWAAGVGDAPISIEEMQAVVADNMPQALGVVVRLAQQLGSTSCEARG
jgi:5'-deoxy-5'-methylthioadenosine phosphorylase